MFNYLKFAAYQIIGFTGSISKLRKFRKYPSSFDNKEVFSFLQHQAKSSLDIVNINLTVLGKERLPDGSVLFIMNHSSMLDSFILFAAIDRPIGVVIADEPIWKNIPVVSKWTELIKCVYINRKNPRDGMRSISQAADNIINGQSMAIFPEGDLTWVKDPDALISDFRSGALKIAYKAKCPIVPMVIKNSKSTYEGYQPIGKIHSVPVEVEFLDPVYDHIENPKLKSTTLGKKIRENMILNMKSYLNKKNAK